MRWGGAIYGDCRAYLTGRETDVNSAAIAMSSHFGFYSSRRAEEELGYRQRPAIEAVQAAWEWFQTMGYVQK
jgi:dihydroflavonol-4-reductase